MKGSRREKAPKAKAVAVAIIWLLFLNLTNSVLTKIVITISKYISVTVLSGPLKKKPPKMFSHILTFLHILLNKMRIGKRMKIAVSHKLNLSLYDMIKQGEISANTNLGGSISVSYLPSMSSTFIKNFLMSGIYSLTPIESVSPEAIEKQLVKAGKFGGKSMFIKRRYWKT